MSQERASMLRYTYIPGLDKALFLQLLDESVYMSGTVADSIHNNYTRYCTVFARVIFAPAYFVHPNF